MLKEAGYKALSDSLLSWKSFELKHSARGAPELALVENAGVHLLASLSHDAGIVVGVVIAQSIKN